MMVEKAFGMIDDGFVTSPVIVTTVDEHGSTKKRKSKTGV